MAEEKKLTIAFIEKAKKIHGSKYDYSKVEYKNSYTKVIISCPKHNFFEQTPNSHLSGSGCLKCGIIKRSKSQSLSTYEFIEKSKRVHGDKYDYSRVKYNNTYSKVIIGCSKHGWFEQMAQSHIKGHECSKCGDTKVSEKLSGSLEKFVLKSKNTHGNKYDYSRVKYKGNDKKVTIGCPEHGWFEQRPNNHANKGEGCPYCGRTKVADKLSLSQDDFIERAKKLHNNKYDYSKVIYKRNHIKIVIGCPKHGWFEQKPEIHLLGSGCQVCGREKNFINITFTRDEFVAKSREVHGDKYDYSRVEYKNVQTKVIIGCPEHGWFEQKPSLHLAGNNCSKCGSIASGKAHALSLEEFILRAKETHNNKYDYSRVEYKRSDKKVTIGCPEHGWFEQRPGSHAKGEGCPKCTNKSEGKIAKYLLKKFIIFRNHRIGNERKLYDFYLPDYNLIIERDGQQHYWAFDFFSRGDEDYIKKQQENDRYKTELAKKHGYKIARIPYWLNDEQVKREIDNILAGNPSYPDVPDLKQAETKPLPK